MAPLQVCCAAIKRIGAEALLLGMLQALLLAGQAVLVYWYCLSLFWSPLEVSGAARGHLRMFVALKSLVFVFSALQLRSGYPPPASYQCAACRSAMLQSQRILSPQPACTAAWSAFVTFHMVICRGGRGRHSFVFTRSTGMISWLGFQVGSACRQ